MTVVGASLTPAPPLKDASVLGPIALADMSDTPPIYHCTH